MDSSIDFLPVQDELAAINDKISSSSANTVTLCDIPGDLYDRLGRNISNQERKQAKVPWVKVVYKGG